MQLQGKIIHFLGDSITQGYGTSAPDKIYHQLIKQRCGLAEANNFGIGGTCLADRYTPLDVPEFNAHFITRVAQMPEKADAIVVFGGTNDFGHGQALLGSPDDRTPETFWGACHDLFSTLIARYPTCPIVVVTPLHRWFEYVPQTRTSRDGSITQTTILRDYVDIIRQAAEYYSLPVCDLYAAGSICPELEAHRTAYCPDGLHPNDAGHEIIASRLISVLESL